MITIRPFRPSDFEDIYSWWIDHGECPPLPGMMTEDGTFVLEHDCVRVMTLTALMTQSKEISYLEGYCSKPGLEKTLSQEFGKILWEYAFAFLRMNGFKRVAVFTDRPALVRRYKTFGMEENLTGLISLGRVL